MSINHGFHWRSWWKLWPHYSSDYDIHFKLHFNVFSISVLQFHWWSK